MLAGRRASRSPPPLPSVVFFAPRHHSRTSAVVTGCGEGSRDAQRLVSPPRVLGVALCGDEPLQHVQPSTWPTVRVKEAAVNAGVQPNALWWLWSLWCGHDVTALSLSISLRRCTEFGWQNVWESDSRHPRAVENQHLLAVESWALTSSRTECEKWRKMHRKSPQNHLNLSRECSEDIHCHDGQLDVAAERKNVDSKQFLHCLDHPRHLSLQTTGASTTIQELRCGISTVCSTTCTHRDLPLRHNRDVDDHVDKLQLRHQTFSALSGPSTRSLHITGTSRTLSKQCTCGKTTDCTVCMPKTAGTCRCRSTGRRPHTAQIALCTTGS